MSKNAEKYQTLVYDLCRTIDQWHSANAHPGTGITVEELKPAILQLLRQSQLVIVSYYWIIPLFWGAH